MAQARGTTGKNEDKTSKKLQNLNVKEEKKKKSSSSSSSSSNTQPSQQPTNLGDRGYDSTTSYTPKQIEDNNKATNAAVIKQKIANANMINNLLGLDAAKLLNQTNTANVINTSVSTKKSPIQQISNVSAFLNALPQDAINAMRRNVENNTLTDSFSKALVQQAKLVATTTAEEYAKAKATKFDIMMATISASSSPKEVTYATSADFLRMQKSGFEVVYVEDGDGDYSTEKGVHTIGRDKLAGLPRGVDIVLVDPNGNFKYIANTGSRAEIVESLQVSQVTKCAALENTINEVIAKRDKALDGINRLSKLCKKYEAIAAKTKSEADIANFQRALNNLIDLQKAYSFANYDTRISNLGARYANTYYKYDEAMKMYYRWTVEDEEAYNKVKARLAVVEKKYKALPNQTVTTNVTDPEYAQLLAQYSDLSARRAKYGDDPMFANSDTLAYFNNLRDSMQKAVDEYNVWGDVAVNPDKGHTLGVTLKKFFNTLIASRDAAVLGDIVLSNEKDISDFGGEAISRAEETGEAFKEVYDSVSAANPFRVGTVARAEWGKAAERYVAALQDAKTPEERARANAVFDEETKYINKQFALIAASNIANNMDVFDLFSVEKEYTAYMMAKHPELYANDPKWIKMQAIYKETYGTDFRGEVDALRMAFNMLNIEAGESSDYVYVDSSSLRHASSGFTAQRGEQYGLFASFVVGFCSDISNWAILPKAIATKAVSAGAKELVKTASTAYIETLALNGVKRAAAEAFVHSDDVQKALLRASKQAINKAVKSGGGDLAEEFVKLGRKEFMTLANTPADDIFEALHYANKEAFFHNATDMLKESAADAINNSFLLRKGTVIAKTLNTVEDTLDDVQKFIFKATCPVAGAVVGISKGIKLMKYLTNAGEISKDALHAAAIAGKQAIARISDIGFDDVLSKSKFNKLTENTINEFYIAMLEQQEKFGKKLYDFATPLSDCADIAMRGFANSYTDLVISELAQRLEKGGLAALEEFASEKGNIPFSQLFDIIEENLATLEKYSPESKDIVDAFKSSYRYATAKENLDVVSGIFSSAQDHVKEIRGMLANSAGNIFTGVNLTQVPDLIAATSLLISDKIKQFRELMNPDFVGDLSSETTAEFFKKIDDLINLLDRTPISISMKKFSADDIRDIGTAISEYCSDISSIYLKNLKDYQDNLLFDTLGKQDYIGNIQRVSVNQAACNSACDAIADSLLEQFKDRGVTEEVIKKAFIDKAATAELDLESINTLYSVMLNKGATVMYQVDSESSQKLVQALTDCNSDVYRLLTFAEESIEETHGKEVAELLNKDAIVSKACAMEATQRMVNLLRAEGLMDSTHLIAVMDSFAGHANYINNIVQSCPPDEAVDKIVEILNRDVAIQLSKHTEESSDFFNYVCRNSSDVLNANTVDTAENVLNIEKIIQDNADLYADDPNCITISFSINRVSEGSMPSDISFHVFGSEDAPFTLHRKMNFDVFDDGFSAGYYGMSAEQTRVAHAALDPSEVLDSDVWEDRLREFITQQRELALADNKTIRFIGFNSSDGLTGNNSYLSRVLRSCDVGVNTANSIDFADVLRMRNNKYIISGDGISSLRRAVEQAVAKARSRSITLDILPTIAYDGNHGTCADLISSAKSALAKQNVHPQDISREFSANIDDLFSTAKTVTDNLGTEAYNRTGVALRMYINADVIEKALIDAGYSSDSVRREIMHAMQNAGSELGLHKIIERKIVERWADMSKYAGGKSFVVSADKIYSAAQRCDQISSGLRRTDLIKDSDVTTLRTMYKQIAKSLPFKSYTAKVAWSIKINKLNAVDLYAATRWIYEHAQTMLSEENMSALLQKLNIGSPRLATYLSDDGFTFLRKNIKDYSSDLSKMFHEKWLDDAEDAVGFTNKLDNIRQNNACIQNLEDYNYAQDALYSGSNIHGTQDKLLAVQSAAVVKPVLDLNDELQQIFFDEFSKEVSRLEELGYDYDFIKRAATEKAHDAWVAAKKQKLLEVCQDSIRSVISLDADAMRAHLIRNCAGGLIIDPNSKMMQGIDLAVALKRWKEQGFDIDTINFTNVKGKINNRKVIRITVPDLPMENRDKLFKKYNHANVDFHNSASKIGNGMRHGSFGGSDMTLMMPTHITSFRDLFFADKPRYILELEDRFRDWNNELYCCNMWTDPDLKMLINPYYTDDIIKNLAQSTHQVRHNVSALHDLGTIMNNPYMNTAGILNSVVRKEGMSAEKFAQESIKQIKANKQRVCKLVLDGKRYKIVDFTSKLNVKTFEDIAKNTILLDDGMYDILSNWSKATNIALKRQLTPEFLPVLYKLYKDTLRSIPTTMWLFGNVATGMRNLVDASTKAFNEIIQSDESITAFLKNYFHAIDDAEEYVRWYQDIEEIYGLGGVNNETIAEYFADKGKEAFNKFNLLYSYEHTSGGDTLSAYTAKQLREKATKFIMEDTDINADVARKISKKFDGVFASPEFRGLSKTQRSNHMTAIHNKCMDSIRRYLDDGLITQEQFDMLSKKVYAYNPTVESWGDVLCKFPVLKHNQAVFQNAETRVRLSLYKTFIESGYSEAEAMAHVTATQFDYAGLGHTEDFLPFTQYKLYNALYWCDHASAKAVSTAWRFAKYNGDTVMNAQAIAEMCTKYRQRQYYLYDKESDEEYSRFAEERLNIAGHILLDGIDSYLGLPRDLQAGSIDLNGTHFFKLGNSFIEETELIVSCAVGAVMFSKNISQIVSNETQKPVLSTCYEALKCTPLFDSFYSPWKAYIDFAMYAYNMEVEASKNKELYGVPHEFTTATMYKYIEQYVANKDTHSLAVSGIPIVGTIVANIVGRAKAFDLNLGEFMALMVDPDAKTNMLEYIHDISLCICGGLFPSLWGTNLREEKSSGYDYYASLSTDYFKYSPTTYFDLYGRLQKAGFDADEAKLIMQYFREEKETETGKYLTKAQYFQIVQDLFAKGYTEDEIINIFAQHNMNFDTKKFLAMSSALPDFLKYDKEKRNEVLAYYEAMGMSRTAAWAKLLSHPAIVINGVLVELSNYDIQKYNEIQNKTYLALQKKKYWTVEDWDAFNARLRELGFYYPKGEQKRVRAYFMKAGYSFEEAQKMILDGFMLNKDGVLVDVQGQARRQVFSYNSLQGAEWDAYWETVPDYTKYEKGAFGRTMKALKKMGYNDEQARAWIQMGIYVSPEGIMMNVTGMERPVLGYPSFNAYYQTLPDYIKYEKGAFKRTYAALKQLGFDYDTSLRLIQQGAYLMDATMAPHVFTTLGARRNRDGSDIKVTDINTLLMRHGGQLIQGADGKAYMLVNCAGLQRPRSTFSYSRRGSGGYGGYSRGYKKKKYERPARYSMYYTRKPFITQGNVSTFTGFTNYRGSNKLAKPYTTKGYVSTYSQQNFLNGSSYGMRKVYKVDMRQFKSGALSTKSAYPASYRNISVAYRRNLYKDMYAKYGASRMRMRSNVPGYSNASIVRLRRNEIQNRERYAERRDQVNKTKTQKKSR